MQSQSVNSPLLLLQNTLADSRNKATNLASMGDCFLLPCNEDALALLCCQYPDSVLLGLTPLCSQHARSPFYASLLALPPLAPRWSLSTLLAVLLSHFIAEYCHEEQHTDV